MVSKLPIVDFTSRAALSNTTRPSPGAGARGSPSNEAASVSKRPSTARPPRVAKRPPGGRSRRAECTRVRVEDQRCGLDARSGEVKQRSAAAYERAQSSSRRRRRARSGASDGVSDGVAGEDRREASERIHPRPRPDDSRPRRRDGGGGDLAESGRLRGARRVGVVEPNHLQLISRCASFHALSPCRTKKTRLRRRGIDPVSRVSARTDAAGSFVGGGFGIGFGFGETRAPVVGTRETVASAETNARPSDSTARLRFLCNGTRAGAPFDGTASSAMTPRHAILSHAAPRAVTSDPTYASRRRRSPRLGTHRRFRVARQTWRPEGGVAREGCVRARAELAEGARDANGDEGWGGDPGRRRARRGGGGARPARRRRRRLDGANASGWARSARPGLGTAGRRTSRP